VLTWLPAVLVIYRKYVMNCFGNKNKQTPGSGKGKGASDAKGDLPPPVSENGDGHGGDETVNADDVYFRTALGDEPPCMRFFRGFLYSYRWLILTVGAVIFVMLLLASTQLSSPSELPAIFPDDSNFELWRAAEEHIDRQGSRASSGAASTPTTSPGTIPVPPGDDFPIDVPTNPPLNVPGSVPNVAALGATESTITVSWNMPSHLGSSIDYYIVGVSGDGGLTWDPSSAEPANYVRPPLSSRLVTGLLSGRTYTVNVIPHNVNGYGAASAFASARTVDPAAVRSDNPAPPTISNASPLAPNAPNEVRVSWQPVGVNHARFCQSFLAHIIKLSLFSFFFPSFFSSQPANVGDSSISEYVVQMKNRDGAFPSGGNIIVDPDGWTTVRRANGNVLTTTVGLPGVYCGGNTYLFRVLASNNEGPSFPGTEHETTHEVATTLPSAIDSLRVDGAAGGGAGSLALIFGLPLCFDSRALIPGCNCMLYELEYRVSNSGGGWQPVSTAVAVEPDTSLPISGLQGSTTYEFRVHTINYLGQGPWSTPTETETLSTEPIAPTFASTDPLIALSASSIRANFLAPTWTGSASPMQLTYDVQVQQLRQVGLHVSVIVLVDCGVCALLSSGFKDVRSFVCTAYCFFHHCSYRLRVTFFYRRCNAVGHSFLPLLS
jgi:hypothetical protein